MTKTKRNVGREILDGLREIKRGEYGRVINVPDVAMMQILGIRCSYALRAFASTPAENGAALRVRLH
jgi:hypothetical protein